MLRFSLLASLLLFSSCEFKSYRGEYRFDPGITYTLRYAAELKGSADGSWGKSPYEASAEAVFSLKGSQDTAKGQVDLNLSVDSLRYRSSERAPDEDQYMVGRLRKYRAHMLLSRTGQILSLEEEPGLPPIEFSPLNFGRLLIYGLTSFPDMEIKAGTHWESVQPLLNKFHPETKVIKRYRFSSLRETPDGRVATFGVEIQALLEEELETMAAGSASAVPGKRNPQDSAILKGKGEVEFNLDKGHPVSAHLELEGNFLSEPPEKPEDSTAAKPLPFRLREKLSLRFLD